MQLGLIQQLLTQILANHPQLLGTLVPMPHPPTLHTLSTQQHSIQAPSRQHRATPPPTQQLQATPAPLGRPKVTPALMEQLLGKQVPTPLQQGKQLLAMQQPHNMEQLQQLQTIRDSGLDLLLTHSKATTEDSDLVLHRVLSQNNESIPCHYFALMKV